MQILLFVSGFLVDGGGDVTITYTYLDIKKINIGIRYVYSKLDRGMKYIEIIIEVHKWFSAMSPYNKNIINITEVNKVNWERVKI